MLEINERLIGHKTIDFDRKALRKAVREGAKLVRREGRKLAGKRSGAGRKYRVRGGVRHRASAPGQPPAKISGALQKSIFYRTMDKGGLAMSVGPSIRRVFYARFLAGGTKHMEARPFMTEALRRHEPSIRQGLRAALVDALVPR
jgi:HK97 gp10 family phage protein